MIFFSFSFTRQVDEFFSLIRYIFENSGFLRRSQKSKTFDVTNYCNNRIDFLNTSIFNKWIAYNWCFFKVWVFWEGHKIWKNLRRTFDKSIVFCARNSVLVKKSTKIFKNKLYYLTLAKTSLHRPYIYKCVICFPGPLPY